MAGNIKQCSAEVYGGISRVKWAGRSRRCKRKAVVVVGGRGYCWQHRPEKSEERKGKTLARLERKDIYKAKLRDIERRTRSK